MKSEMQKRHTEVNLDSIRIFFFFLKNKVKN